jgi:hypothetical protein
MVQFEHEPAKRSVLAAENATGLTATTDMSHTAPDTQKMET